MSEQDEKAEAPTEFDASYEAGPLIALVHEVARLTSLQVDDALRPYNLTRAQFLTLVTLMRRNGAHQSDIAQSLRMGRSAVGKLLDRLEAGGYIRREHDPFDARAVRVFLSGSARERLEDIAAAADARCGEILTPLSAPEREALTRSLTALRDNLGADPRLLAALASE